jgi:hypothetical protein
LPFSGGHIDFLGSEDASGHPESLTDYFSQANKLQTFDEFETSP